MNIESTLKRRGYDIAKAHSAIRALLDDPDDLPQVFTVIDALSGDTIERIAKRVGESSDGAKLLDETPNIVDTLRDREALRAMPEGSLGRAYLRFLESEGISADGIIEASDKTEAHHAHAGESRQQTWVRERMRDTHDLWHAVTGYKGDVAGEIALLAFSFAQVRNPAIALIIAAAMSKGLTRTHGRLILDGFVRGAKARYFPEQRWETMLAKPVSEVRAMLGVGDPPVYEPLRSAQLRAEGVLPAKA
ncbi:MAG: hypothetical protein JNK05_32815 [Myxococcales bacterium]|nr:hypothetical protein [Myxococcales bacterium]